MASIIHNGVFYEYRIGYPSYATAFVQRECCSKVHAPTSRSEQIDSPSRLYVAPIQLNNARNALEADVA